MIEAQISHRQQGIRQRSIARHCRFGRATRLVLVLTTGASVVIGGSAIAQQTWIDGNANNTWDQTQPNWDGGVGFVNGSSAVFSGPGETVTVGEPGGITVNDLTTSGSYTFTGNALTVNGELNTVGPSGAATIDLEVVGDLTITGDGNVLLDTSSSVTGNVVNADSQSRLDLFGTIGGNLDNAGNTTVSNDIGGALTQSTGTTLIMAPGVSVGEQVDIDGGLLFIDPAGELLADTSNTQPLDVEIGSAGTLEVYGALVADQVATDGTTLVDGTITGSLSNTGDLDNDGTITGDVSNDENLELSGSIGGALSQSGGATIVDGNAAEVGAEVDLSGGSLTIGAGQQLTADTSGTRFVDVRIGAGATLDVEGTLVANRTETAGTAVNDGTITGVVVNTGTFDNNGRVSSSVDNSGDLNLSRRIDGDLTQSFGSTTVDGIGGRVGGVADINGGTLTVETGQRLAAVGGVDIAGTATLDVDGALVADQTNNAGIANNDGIIGGSVINSGAFDNNGQVTGRVENGLQLDLSGRIGGDLVQSAGSTTVDGFGARVDGAVDINGGVLTVDTGQRLAAVGGVDIATDAILVVNGALVADQTTVGGTAVNESIIGGNVSNNGMFDNNGRVTRDVTNSADLDLSGSIGGDLIQSAGATTVDGFDARVDGAVNINGGTLTVETGQRLRGVGGVEIANGATLAVDGRLVADQTNNAGIANNEGVIDGSVSNSGRFDNNGRVSQSVANSGDFNLSGTIGGTLTQSAGTTTVDGAGARVGGLVDINGGTLNIEATQNLAALDDVDIADGATLAVNGTLVADQTTNAGNASNTGSIEGAVSNSGVFDNDGNVTRNVDNSGTLNLAGEIGGALTQSAGSTIVDGTAASVGGQVDLDGGSLTINAGQSLSANTRGSQTVDVDVASGTTLTVNGTLNSDRTDNFGTVINTGTMNGLVENAGSFDNDGTVTGDFENAGTLALSGTIDGSLNNTGTTIIDGDANVAGGVTNLAGSVMTFSGGTLETGAIASTNALQDFGLHGAGIGLSAAAPISTAQNRRTISLAGDFTNVQGATIRVEGTGEIGGNLVNEGSMVFQTEGAGEQTVDDVLRVTGDATLNGTVVLDADLNAAGEGQTSGVIDRIEVDGTLSGDAVFTFQNVSDLVSEDITLEFATFGAGTEADQNFTIDREASGFGSTNPVLYRLNTDFGAGTISLDSFANPAIGGLVSGITLTQSLIGAVVNRPSSAFVTPLADPSDDPCSIGTWGRVVGGEADLDGETESNDVPFTNALSAQYSGLQVGADTACVDGRYNGWDLGAGVSLGVNTGKTTLPVFDLEFVEEPGNSGSAVVFGSQVSNVETDFSQVYAAPYVFASRDGWSVDVQYRYETTEFDVEDKLLDPTGTSSFALDTQSYDATGHTISGSVGYVYVLNEEKGWFLRPQGGLSLSRVEVDDITLGQDTTATSDDSVLRIDTIDRRLAFGSLLLGRQQVLPSQTAALTYFGVATIYEDFSDPTVARLISQGSSADAALPIESEGLGTFGEISLGVNYTQILNSGSALPARQMDISARVDTRMSDSLDSWGLTAQVRFQF